MAKKSSYTEKDFEEHEKYLEMHPDCPRWTTLDGHTIPIVLLKDDHLKNIIKHQKDRIERIAKVLPRIFYSNLVKVHDVCKEEMRQRLINNTKAGRLLFGDNDEQV